MFKYTQISDELVDGMAGVAAFHMKSERWSHALKCLEELIKARPDRGDFWHLKANALRRLEKHSDALADAQRAHELMPEDDDVAISLAELFIMNYDFVQATRLLVPIFNRDYDPGSSVEGQPQRVKRAGFALAIIQRLGHGDDDSQVETP